MRSIRKPNKMEVLEEADNIIVCHIGDMPKSGISRISVRTVDSDVVVILLSFLSTFLDVNSNLELYVDYNTGSKRRNICLNTCYNTLGENVCKSLLYFHCFTGADSTFSFFFITKNTWFPSRWDFL